MGRQGLDWNELMCLQHVNVLVCPTPAVTSEYSFRDAFQDTSFGIYLFHILYSRQLKRLKDVQRPLFFQNSVMGRQGTCIKMKASLTMLKALSLSGMKTGYFLLHISASNIHAVWRGSTKAQAKAGNAPVGQRVARVQGMERVLKKTKNGPFWPWNFLEIQQNQQNRWKVYEISWCFLFLFFLADTWSLCLFAFRCPWSNVQRAARGALTVQSCHVSDLFLENGQTSVRKSKVHEYPRRIQKVTTDALQWLTN